MTVIQAIRQKTIDACVALSAKGGDACNVVVVYVLADRDSVKEDQGIRNDEEAWDWIARVAFEAQRTKCNKACTGAGEQRKAIWCTTARDPDPRKRNVIRGARELRFPCQNPNGIDLIVM